MESTKPRIGGLQIGIILLTLATAVMHAAILFPDFLFILNALGYVGLLAVLYLPIPLLTRYRSAIRWTLLAYTLLTILIWVAIGQRDLYAYTNKLIEAALVVLLWLESRQ